jgi:hypothetical protein
LFAAGSDASDGGTASAECFAVRLDGRFHMMEHKAALGSLACFNAEQE